MIVIQIDYRLLLPFDKTTCRNLSLDSKIAFSMLWLQWLKGKPTAIFQWTARILFRWRTFEIKPHYPGTAIQKFPFKLMGRTKTLLTIDKIYWPWAHSHRKKIRSELPTKAYTLKVNPLKKGPQDTNLMTSLLKDTTRQDIDGRQPGLALYKYSFIIIPIMMRFDKIIYYQRNFCQLSQKI